jgi:DNA-binding MarR family transcriptional regulator
VPPATHPSAPEPAVARGCTCSRLRRLTRRVTAVYDHALAAAGLRVTQYSLLSHLRGRALDGARDGRPVALLADALDMDRTTLSRNLKPLVAAGWVEVDACADDARQRLVRITPAGVAQLDAARVHWRRAQDEVTATLGAEDTARLHRMVDDFLPRLRRPAEPE